MTEVGIESPDLLDLRRQHSKENQLCLLSNLVPDPQAPIFVLLRRVAIAHKQELVAKQLLSILEILGNLPETVEIARSTGNESGIRSFSQSNFRLAPGCFNL